jgi:hypothetical protein
MIGASLGISLTLCLVSICLLLLAVRQQTKRDSTIRVELAGSPLTYGAPTSPPTSPSTSPKKTTRDNGRQTAVADLAELTLPVDALGPIMGGLREENKKQQEEQEQAILQEILHDNLRLQEQIARKGST